MTRRFQCPKQRLVCAANNCIRVAITCLISPATHAWPSRFECSKITEEPCFKFLYDDSVDDVEIASDCALADRCQTTLGGMALKCRLECKTIVFITIN